MRVLQRDISEEKPRLIHQEDWDLVWVRCDGLHPEAPFTGQALQWLDWNLQGQLQRWWLAAGGKDKVTFFPTFGKVSPRWIALDPGTEFDVETLVSTCTGLGVKQVCILCQQASEVVRIEKQVKTQKSDNFAERVVVSSDPPAGAL